MTVKWQTLWQVFLSFCIGGAATFSVLTSGQQSIDFWIASVSATALLVWSNQGSDRRRIKELERQAETDRKLRDAMVGRLADLMDSARRTDPTYQQVDDHRRQVEAYLNSTKDNA